jgi:Archaea-specific editing domain of threonyl-tRNA synthetase
VVVILTCIESADTETEVAHAAVHTTHMIHEWHSGNSNVVVLPFAHLSSDIAQPPASLTRLNAFVSFLAAYGCCPRLATFGSHKDWMVDVHGYPRATSWFHFPPNCRSRRR